MRCQRGASVPQAQVKVARHFVSGYFHLPLRDTPTTPLTPTRRHADTPIRRYADTPIRRYADTPIRRYADTPRLIALFQGEVEIAKLIGRDGTRSIHH